MSSENNNEFGSTNKKGEWRPPYNVQFAPVFTWPPKPGAFFKWLFGYPGFIWPWQLLFFLLSAASWLWLQPDLSRCVTFSPDWILQMLLRNMALLWIFSGGWHLLLYNLKAQGTKQKYDPRWQSKDNKKFLFNNQVLDNIFWSCFSGVPIWTAYEVLFMWAWANNKIPYLQWAAHPVYIVLGFFLIPFWREFHFYWIHRLIHWKPLYKKIHYLHHLNVNPGPSVVLLK